MAKKPMTTDIAEKSIDNILELKNITKTFLGGKIIANDNVTLSFARNEVHAIVGENGSGKSTLMNIIFGLYKQDNGDILINGEEVDMYESGAAALHKIGMVHQHFHLVDSFTVLQNVILGQEDLSLTDEELEEIEKEIKKWNSILKDLKKDETLLDEIMKENGHDSLWKENVKNTQAEIKKEIKSLQKEMVDAKPKAKKELDFKIIKLTKDLEGNVSDKLNWEVNYLENKIEELESKSGENKSLGFMGKINKKVVLKRYNEIVEKYNIKLDPNELVSKLPVGQRQMVEILKVLWKEKDILVFDEPTATLSVVEIEELLKTIQSLKAEGKTIIFISHKLQEVKTIADRVSVLRKGVMMGTHINDKALDTNKIATEMVGKVINLDYPKRKIDTEEIFEFKNISYVTSKGFKALDDVSFTIKEGEIFGLAGIEGNGQEQVMQIVAGLRKATEGEVSFKGEVIATKKGNIQDPYVRLGMMSHVPIDRMKHAIVPAMSLKFNSMITTYNTPEFSKKWKTMPRTKLEKLILIELTKRVEYAQVQLDNALIENEDPKKVDSKTELIKKFAWMQSRVNRLTLEVKTNETDEINKEIVALNKELENFKENKNEILSSKVKPLKDKESKLNLETAKADLSSYLRKIPGKSKRLDTSKTDEWTSRIIEELRVDGAYSNNIPIKNLSGGNQQKFVVGREILRPHDLILAGHPTRGLDISAIDHIYTKMLENSKGKATLLYSLEISELVAVCDRMAIMYKGKIVDIIDPKSTSMDKISRMMIGEVK